MENSTAAERLQERIITGIVGPLPMTESENTFFLADQDDFIFIHLPYPKH